MTRAALGPLAACIALAGCGAPATAPQRPDAALPAGFAGQAAEPAAAPSPTWWTAYGEPPLDALVEQALARNLDLRLAAARIDEAAVALGLARAAQWPQVDLGAAVTRSRASALAGQPLPPGGAESSLHRVALSTSFEIDLWGRLRHASAAAQEQLLAAQTARETVRLALAGTTVQTWFTLRALQAQRAVLAGQQRLRRESLQLAERRLAGGLASGLDVAQARAALAAVAAQDIELARQQALLVHLLGELSGQPALALEVPAGALPQPLMPPPGLPSQLLARRPDLRQAEAQMRASFEQFEVARKSAWPTLALTGSFGAQSSELADLLHAGARLWSIGPSLLVSVFDAGRNQARTDEARARAEQAAIGWQKATLTAFREVADALTSASQAQAQEAEVEVQRQAAAEALRIAQRRYEAGYSGYLDLLEAQRGVQDADLAALRARATRLDASVALVKALGGGWDGTLR